MNSSRARGALLGLAVGDALGTTLEFQRLEAPAFPALAAGPHQDVLGGGPFHLVPGQVTDDTHMACCLADSLHTLGCFDAADVARRYIEWSKVTFDIGRQTQASLYNVSRGETPSEAGRSFWVFSRREPAGNGSLMRTAPIGVHFAGDPAARRRAALDDSAITHFDPRCRLACAGFNAAIAAAVGGIGEPRPAAMLSAARAEIDDAATELAAREPDDADHTRAARTALLEDLDAAQMPDPRLYSKTLHLHLHQGFVRVALRLAFWELMHAPTWKAGVVDAVNRGGDADTNGAITGALLGACHGAPSIPAPWSDRVLAALADGPPGPFRDRYHPRRLLELVPEG